MAVLIVGMIGCEYDVTEPVLDWAETGEFAASTPNTFTITKDSDGIVIYIGTDHTDLILIFDPDDRSQDIHYKDILPFYVVHLISGINNYMYMLLSGDEWNILRIDIGTPERRIYE